MVRLAYADKIGERVTQAKMAKVCGVSESAYKQWEANNSAPEHLVDVAKNLQRTIGADAKFILGLDETFTGPSGGGQYLKKKNVIDLHVPTTVAAPVLLAA